MKALVGVTREGLPGRCDSVVLHIGGL